MTLPVNIIGSATLNPVEADASGNLLVNMPTVVSQAGMVGNLTVQDMGTVAGARTYRQMLESTVFRRLAIGQDMVLWYDSFAATAQNTAIWKAAATTFTFTQSAGYLNFNPGAVTTANSAQMYQSYRYFTLNGNSGLEVIFNVLTPTAPPANAQMEFGLFNANTASTPFTPADGVYFRLNSAGVFGVSNYAGVETVSGALVAAGSIPVNTNLQFRMVITEQNAEFWWMNPAGTMVYLGQVLTPAGNGQPGSSVSFPLSARLFFSGTAGSAWAPKISNTAVVAVDTQVGMTQGLANAISGLMGYQGQNGNAMGTTAIYSNSQAAGAGAAMTNTAAVSTGLGGQISVLPTLAVGTDGILCSFTNPAGTVAIPGRNLVITGVTIQGGVTTVLTGGPVLYAYSLAFGHTAVSLATAEGALAKAPRRIALGLETYAVTAAVGAVGSAAGVGRQFQSPIVVAPGESVAVVAKNLGVVTTLGVITILVTLDCYWV